MPSPFPGMNPYLERREVWRDFHTSFILYTREVLAAQVRPRYYVRVEEQVYVQEPGTDERFPLGRPDVSVHIGGGGLSAGGAAVAAPAFVGLPAVLEEEDWPYLEITDTESQKVVTVIELLSPTNKGSRKERDQYRAKVQRVLASDTNFVEIDLLRGGPRTPWAEMPPCDYCAVVSVPADREHKPPRAGVWAIRLRDPLPRIPIPLRPGEPESMLDLQAVLHRTYDAGGYGLFLYRREPDPPLAPADAVWAVQILHPPGPPEPTSAPSP